MKLTRICKFMETESRIQISEGEKRELMLNGHRVSVGVTEKFW